MQTKDFPELWKILWNGTVSKRYQSEFEQAKAKFVILKNNGTIHELIKKSITAWKEPEWGFPKGRKSSKETEIACALRETQEEAGICIHNLRIVTPTDIPLLEEYVGSNGIHYKYKYWIAEAPAGLDVKVDLENIEQMREISDVKWFSVTDAQSIIRPYNIEKINVLLTAHGKIQSGVF